MNTKIEDQTFLVPAKEITGQEITGQEITGQEITGQEITGQEITGQEITGQEITGQEITGQEIANAAPAAGVPVEASSADDGPALSSSADKAIERTIGLGAAPVTSAARASLASDPSAPVVSESRALESVSLNQAATPAVPATGATNTPRPSGSALANAESTLLATAKIPAAIRPLLGAAPCCAGEQGALSLDILNLHIEVWNPVGLREWQALKRIADCDWECIRYGKATTWGFNAVIARSLFRRIIEHACDKELARLAKEQKFPTHADPSVEMQLSQECFLLWRRTALKAAMGDPAAKREVECELGPGTVVLDVFAAKEFEEHIPSQIKIECLIQAALKTRDDAYDELEALVSARQQRQASNARWMPGMSLSEYARSKIIPPTAPQDVLTSATNGAPSDSAHGVEKADIERPCVTDVDVEVPQGAPSQQPTSEVCDVDVKVPTDTSTESAPTKAVETDRSGTTSVDGSSDGTSEIVCDDSMVRQ